MFTITDPIDGPNNYTVIADVGTNGEAVARLALESSSQSDVNDTGLCDECFLTFVAGECLSGDCENYDMEATTSNMDVLSSVSTPTLAAG